MKIKVSKASGPVLDWMVAKAMKAVPHPVLPWKPSTDWTQGGPIIEGEDISVIRLDDESIPDAQGSWQGKYVPQWGAVIGDKHSPEEQHGSQGDCWGESYHVDEDAIRGETPLTAAMRCFVSSKLGEEVEVPEELIYK